jgi:hypothetical protein
MPVHKGDEPFHLGHDLGADAVAGEEEELVGGHGGSLVFDSVMTGRSAS